MHACSCGLSFCVTEALCLYTEKQALQSVKTRGLVLPGLLFACFVLVSCMLPFYSTFPVPHRNAG